MRVRPLALADLDWIEHLEPVLFGLGAWSRQTYVDELRREDRSYLAAVDEDGTRLGYAGVALDPEWNIMTVGVAPSARRRGVATVLLDALIAQAREAGGDELFLEVRSADGTTTRDLSGQKVVTGGGVFVPSAPTVVSSELGNISPNPIEIERAGGDLVRAQQAAQQAVQAAINGEIR